MNRRTYHLWNLTQTDPERTVGNVVQSPSLSQFKESIKGGRNGEELIRNNAVQLPF